MGERIRRWCTIHHFFYRDCNACVDKDYADLERQLVGEGRFLDFFLDEERAQNWCSECKAWTDGLHRSGYWLCGLVIMGKAKCVARRKAGTLMQGAFCNHDLSDSATQDKLRELARAAIEGGGA